MREIRTSGSMSGDGTHIPKSPALRVPDLKPDLALIYLFDSNGGVLAARFVRVDARVGAAIELFPTQECERDLVKVRSGPNDVFGVQNRLSCNTHNFLAG